jgi:hypothetical protein
LQAAPQSPTFSSLLSNLLIEHQLQGSSLQLLQRLWHTTGDNRLIKKMVRLLIERGRLDQAEKIIGMGVLSGPD